MRLIVIKYFNRLTALYFILLLLVAEEDQVEVLGAIERDRILHLFNESLVHLNKFL